MHGQWIGRYEGSNKGLVIVDLDDCGSHFEGSALVTDDDGLPASVVFLRSKDRASTQRFENLPINFLQPNTFELATREELISQFGEQGIELSLPHTGTADFEHSDEGLKIAWRTDIGTEGSTFLHHSQAGMPSVLQPITNVTNWAEFKECVVNLELGRFMFRGQAGPWRLRTSFHRTRRKNLGKFIGTDVPRLHQVLSGRTRHLFNLMDAPQNGAFWNLIQHHGYPTPLLDWSHSPFVAAFFAFREKRLAHHGEKVRVLMFDREQWCSDFQQMQKVAPCGPHFSVLEALAIENERLVPQQALSSISNIDDIESYIQAQEQHTGRTYLFAIDLPASFQTKAMNELALMGITAGSLFPGLDGTCEEWRTRLFGCS